MEDVGFHLKERDIDVAVATKAMSLKTIESWSAWIQRLERRQ